jgi:hypothetical protein
MLHAIVIILLVCGILAANLPWLSERVFFFFEPAGGKKGVAIRLLEWLVLLLIFIVAALGAENKVMGSNYHQGWEFYAVLVCLFLVFALPGFIYRYDLKPHLEKRERRSK